MRVRRLAQVAAATVVGATLAEALLPESDAKMRKDGVVWRETGDCHAAPARVPDGRWLWAVRRRRRESVRHGRIPDLHNSAPQRSRLPK